MVWCGVVDGVTGDVMWGHVWGRKYCKRKTHWVVVGQVCMYTYVCTCMYISAILFGVQRTHLEFCLYVQACVYVLLMWQWYIYCNQAFCHCYWKTMYNCLHFGLCSTLQGSVLDAAQITCRIVQYVLGCPWTKRTLAQCPMSWSKAGIAAKGSVFHWWIEMTTDTLHW